MIFKLTPACKDYLWGGNTLKQAYGKAYDGEVLAETWELSCHPDGPSVICGGTQDGKTLADYLSQHPEALGSAPARFEEFPILIKLIDAAKDLSIQVHPDNAYAKEHENQYGKTEMWYVVEAQPGAGLYYGFEHEISAEEFRRAIEENTLCDKLHRVDVKPGDVFFIEAGTIHAIGAGLVIAEIQQSSNVTYRVYDYGRKGADGKPRELHVEKACEVTSLRPAKNDYDFGTHLGKCKYFTVDRMEISGETTLETDGTSFHSLLFLSGEAQVKSGSECIEAKKGDSIFIGADTGKYTVTGNAVAVFTRLERQRYRIGIDLGGTGIKAGVVDESNEIVGIAKRKTLAGRPWEEIAKDMAMAALDAMQQAGITAEDCISVGIGSPGTIDPQNGVVVYSNNLDWNYVPLADEIKKYIPLPVFISNDANCAALGEVVAGTARGCQNAVLLTLGTGVGGGVILDGKVMEGGVGGAELGHTTLIAGGELCTCGRRGCIECYGSATALIREANRAADAHPDSLLASMRAKEGEMNGLIAFEAMKQGDEVAKAVIDQYIEWVSEMVTNFVNIFRPEMVLLSGGICGQGRVLTDPVNAYVEKYAFAGKRIFIPPVMTAKLGNDAGIIGAANLGQV